MLIMLNVMVLVIGYRLYAICYLGMGIVVCVAYSGVVTVSECVFKSGDCSHTVFGDVCKVVECRPMLRL